VTGRVIHWDFIYDASPKGISVDFWKMFCKEVENLTSHDFTTSINQFCFLELAVRTTWLRANTI
jgi:hypothetical protein